MIENCGPAVPRSHRPSLLHLYCCGTTTLLFFICAVSAHEKAANAACRRPGFDHMAGARVGPPGNFPLLNYSTIFLSPNRPRPIAFYLRVSLVAARFAAGPDSLRSSPFVANYVRILRLINVCYWKTSGLSHRKHHYSTLTVPAQLLC